ncbi:4Fe-4S dicluster domain-containing protein [Reichenbachiella sp. MALMAid0571]|uniref:4Fe-4S dicluster domain-containing protein n=1 Tax=Reichenbachiella sp. MALMAid0571 TaxID=3143939 RepID=UPI0032DF15DE
MRTYLSNIKDTIYTFSQGFKLTMRHFFQARTMRDPIGIKDDNYFEKKEGIVTLQYPFEELPVPDNGRYQLHNEIDDCIVCDKCAKVCPVNCIDIEPVKALEEIGKTSDGTPKRIYAAKFDIDMAKCCFCGLCTTVCPTECLTMTKEYDFSVFDLTEHNFVFGNMSEEEVAEKKEELEKHNAAKQKEKEAKPVVATASELETEEKKKTVFKPKVKNVGSDDVAKKPVFKPKVKAKTETAEDKGIKVEESTKPVKPVFRPKIKAKSMDSETQESKVESEPIKQKPVFRPKIKVKEKPLEEPNDLKSEAEGERKEEIPKTKKPVFRPKIKPKK